MRAHHAGHDPRRSVYGNAFRLTVPSVRERPMGVVLMKRVAGFGRGVYAFVFEPATRSRRLRARSAHARRSYEVAARDPEFMAQMAEVDQDFNPTAADGLND